MENLKESFKGPNPHVKALGRKLLFSLSLQDVQTGFPPFQANAHFYPKSLLSTNIPIFSPLEKMIGWLEIGSERNVGRGRGGLLNGNIARAERFQKPNFYAFFPQTSQSHKFKDLSSTSKCFLSFFSGDSGHFSF